MSAVPAVLLHPLASTPTQHLRPKEVGQEVTGRACAPWLIARGRSLDVPRLDRVALHHSSFGSDAGSARFATILVELGIANPSDWEACAGEPAKFLRCTLDRFVRRHGESEIDEAFELSVTLSTDPHEWCESEEEPDGSQIFLCVEASSCGFVNLAPALALCENEHPRLPATFARMFLNSVGSHFRVYDDRDAEEHISILEDNYEPEADGEERAGLPDRNKILPPCMKRKPLDGKGLKAMLSRMTPQEPSSTSAASNSRTQAGIRQGKASGDPGTRPRTVLRLQSSSSGSASDLPIGRCHRGVFRGRAPIDAGADTGALAADSAQRDGS